MVVDSKVDEVMRHTPSRTKWIEKSRERRDIRPKFDKMDKGSAETRYMKFEDAIRKEYKYVPWFLFKKKRIKLLQYFLSRESIYSTEYYIDSLEKQARRNIESAIDNLKNA